MGRVLTTSEGGTALTYTYDDLGRNISFTDQAGRTSTYAYDLVGNRTSTTYPGGVTVNRAHDGSNRVTALKDGSGNLQAAYSYDLLDRPTGLTLGNGTSVAYNYDLLNRVTSVNNTLGGTVTRNYAYVYDAASRRTSETGPRGAVAYGYTNRNEISGVTEPSSSPFADQSFSYDAGFNRSQWTNGSASTSYDVNNLNQYTTVSGSTAPAWNSDGGLASYNGNTYIYDALMRLVEVDNAGGKYLFSYDPTGRRVKKIIETTGGTVLQTYAYHYDGSEVAVEYQPSVTWTYYLGLGIDQPVMRVSGATKQWYYANAQGSISAVADNSGTILEQYEYNAQGQFQVQDANGAAQAVTQIGNFILYTGRNYDYETGNYFYRARYYSPVLGRFVSRDPLSGAEFSQGTNLYAYCGNNFLNANDPTGMDLYQVTHTDYGGGAGHAALISGSGNSYELQSYGSDTLGSSAGSSSSNGGVSTAYFNNLGDALQYASDKGYDQVNQWHTNSDQDAAAQQAVSNENSQSYNLVTNNCQTAVDNGLNAAGVTYNNSVVPSIAAKQDQSLSDNHYATPTKTPPAKKTACSGSSGSSSSS